MIKQTSVIASIEMVPLLTKNNRISAIIYNGSDYTLKIPCADDVVIELTAKGFFELNKNYIGPLSGYWTGEDGECAVITEIFEDDAL